MRGDDQIPARRYSLAPVETYEIEKQQFDYIEDEALISLLLAAAFSLIPVAVTLNVTLVTAPIKAAGTVAILWGVTVAFYPVGDSAACLLSCNEAASKRT